jgi:putative transposase
MIAGVTSLAAAGVEVQQACAALSVSRATWYRRQLPALQAALPRPTPARALSSEQRQEVLDTLCQERFVDRSPVHVVATLLSEGKYLCSTRTMYRILEDNKASKERRNQRRHPNYTKPELLATAPNQVWSWDITRLRGSSKWSAFYLFVMMDIFSRHVVGWMLASTENADLAGQFIKQTYAKHSIEPETLTIHSDRGAPMTAKTTGELLIDLGVARSLSRPQVSNDNPFSEATFKTVKYHSTFPNRFDDQDAARRFCGTFFDWYNNEHCHSGVAMLPPADVYYGRAAAILLERQCALDAAYARHPERFTAGPPRVAELPQTVWLNKPDDEAKESDESAP